MKIEEIKSLIQEFKDSDLTSLEIKLPDCEIRLDREQPPRLEVEHCPVEYALDECETMPVYGVPQPPQGIHQIQHGYRVPSNGIHQPPHGYRMPPHGAHPIPYAHDPHRMGAAPMYIPESQPPHLHEEQPNSSEITAPMVGTFYVASAPTEKPFVSVGDTVRKGQVICIIEAMKLMNEVEADKDGVVKKILVENGKMVEFGEGLFLIEESKM
ncbi:MAG: acetyl-CoA carboxylase, biotin carboxyl carrier protein [Epulopiscium sp. Nuni2H_MBin001]|nr:MAG: acetyl-CoA carboxylase, biotin carboxyl carrier protein [Epulopiscium sp. Nuni2H_MBin001]